MIAQQKKKMVMLESAGAVLPVGIAILTDGGKRSGQ